MKDHSDLQASVFLLKLECRGMQLVYYFILKIFFANWPKVRPLRGKKFSQSIDLRSRFCLIEIHH